MKEWKVTVTYVIAADEKPEVATEDDKDIIMECLESLSYESVEFTVEEVEETEEKEAEETEKEVESEEIAETESELSDEDRPVSSNIPETIPDIE